MNPVLRITDGVTSMNILNGSEIFLESWSPTLADDKKTFADSPIGDERFLVYRRMGTAIETFNIHIRGKNQNSAISRYRRLQELMEQSKKYWTRPAYEDSRPVYIHARSAKESNSRYAIIVDVEMTTDINPYAQPFLKSDSSIISATILVERGQWRSYPPGLHGADYLEGGFITSEPLSVVKLDSTTDNIDCANHADIDTLISTQITVEGWFRIIGDGFTGANNEATLFSKEYLGGILPTNFKLALVKHTGKPYELRAGVNVGSGPAASAFVPGSRVVDGDWHHIAMTFNNLTARIPVVLVDGSAIEPSAMVTPTAALSVDTEDFVIGNGPDTLTTYAPQADISWCRISSVDRYPPNSGTPEIEADGTTLTIGWALTGSLWYRYPSYNPALGSYPGDPASPPYFPPGSDGTTPGDPLGLYALYDFPPLCDPPTVDAYTKGQWNMSERTGSTVDNETGVAALDGTITGGVWTSASFCHSNVEDTVERPYTPNYHVRSTITDVYTYDTSATAYSGNLIGTSLPYTLANAPVQSGDIMYFGNSNADHDGPFTSVIFDLVSGIEEASGSSVWEYYNGAGWTTLTTDAVINDEFGAFTKAGISGMFFRLPSNWAKENLNTILGGAAPSVDGWWVRHRMTSSPSDSVIDMQQQNREVYTANRGGVILTEDAVTGELGAAARLLFEQKKGTFDVFLMGTKRTGGTGGFTPYINIVSSGNEQNETGITVATSGGAIGATSLWPSGERGTSVHAGLGTDTYTISIPGGLAKRYAGEYRAFATLSLASGTASNVFKSEMYYKVNDSDTPTSVGEVLVNQVGIAEYYGVYDYGIFTIAEDPARIGNIEITVTLESYDGGGGTAYIYQVILFPVDGDFYGSVRSAIDSTLNYQGGYNPNTAAEVNNEHVLLVDGIGNPRSGATAQLLSKNSDALGSYTLSAPTGVYLPVEPAMLWTFAFNTITSWGASPSEIKHSGPDTIVRATINTSNMYHALIGE